ncbi:MAG: hypothetical protein NZ926_00965 [Candidatus Methanomethylicia archaeon]|nr:hypothetical protein [Candidatus Methanomethylicia archaeon]MCX8169002.1 hypothetical protein [Candidatus Methanomethylicia archaeon]
MRDPTLDELRDILNVADLRTKVACSLMAFARLRNDKHRGPYKEAYKETVFKRRPYVLKKCFNMRMIRLRAKVS